jgi:GYF domain 2
MQLIVSVNGEQQGPFSVDQIKGYLAMGHFQHSDLAWHEGATDWRPLGEFPEFAVKAHRTPNYKAVQVRQMTEERRKGGKSKNALFWVLAVVVVAAAGGGGYYYWKNYLQKGVADKGTTAGTNSQDLAASQPGDPKTLEELNSWYAEPAAGQNAATFFEQGFDALQITNADRNSSSLPLIGKAAMPLVNVPFSSGMKTALRGFLERNSSALELFQRGAQCSGSRYPLDLTKGFGASISHLAKVRQAAQMAELSALTHADARQGTNAGQGVLLSLASARTLEPEPWLISQLVRVACEITAADALEQTVNRVVMPAELLTQLQSAFDQAVEYDAAGTGFNRALIGERVVGLSTFDLPPEKLRELLSLLAATSEIDALRTNNTLRSTPDGTIEKALGNLKEQRQIFEESMNQMIVAHREALPGRLKASDVMTPRVDETKAKGYLLCATLLSGFGKVTSREAAGLARLRLAQTAVALERFRAANNHFPDSPNELAPKFLAAVPNDPFDGQPLRYRKSVEGFLLYSVGPDLKDDGGARKPGSDDLSFVVVRPPKAM